MLELVIGFLMVLCWITKKCGFVCGFNQKPSRRPVKTHIHGLLPGSAVVFGCIPLHMNKRLEGKKGLLHLQLKTGVVNSENPIQQGSHTSV